MRSTPATLAIFLTLAAAAATSGVASARPFGEKGQYIITTDANLDFERSTTKVEGLPNETVTSYSFLLSGDYTRFNHVTFGAEVGFEGTVEEVDTAKGLRLGVRVGYVQRLSNGISLWPRVGVGYANTTYQFATEQYTVSTTRASASLPLVFNPYPLIIVGVAPTFEHDFRASAGDDSPVDAPKTTAFGVHLMLGFWFE
jgi:hypothetical protein